MKPYKYDLKRYLVFEYSSYYPCGGLADVSGSFDNMEEAIKKAKNSVHDYQTVWDRIEDLVVYDN